MFTEERANKEKLIDRLKALGLHIPTNLQPMRTKDKDNLRKGNSWIPK